jgi:hypothetical protein
MRNKNCLEILFMFRPSGILTCFAGHKNAIARLHSLSVLNDLSPHKLFVQ